MRADIRRAYPANPAVLGIFPVAAYTADPATSRSSIVRCTNEGQTRPAEPPGCIPKIFGEYARVCGKRKARSPSGAIPRYNNETGGTSRSTRAS